MNVTVTGSEIKGISIGIDSSACFASAVSPVPGICMNTSTKAHDKCYELMHGLMHITPACYLLALWREAREKHSPKSSSPPKKD